MSERRMLWGYEFDPGTGKLYLPGEAAAVSDLTFQDATVMDVLTGRVIPANPLQFATHHTAVRVRELANEVFPDARFEIVETTWPRGPFMRSAVEFGLRRAGGAEVYNCGALANMIIRQSHRKPADVVRVALAEHG